PLVVLFSLYLEPPALFAKVSDFKFVHQAGFPYSFKRPNHRVHDVMHLDDALAVRLPLIRQAQPPIHLIASVGIGKLAYYGSDLEILDLVGLTDKTIAKSTRSPPKDAFLIPGHQRTDPDYVFSRKPDLIDISKKDAPILVLPAIRDLWNDARLARDYHWDDGLGGYRRNE
ncbi:MAG TPA: hypothetical protein VLC91_01235, partial [Spongiibacteraceae bacterium]|nr:hypothetical protein [Spongiibacteraceae bacterium]